jgi:two-component sensor histidine kinase
LITASRIACKSFPASCICKQKQRDPASEFHNAAARVAAIAAVHQQLHQYDDVGTVALDRYLIDLCQQLTAASSSPDRVWPLFVDANPVIVSTDVAVPLALIVNELVTNAIRHSRPVDESGSVHIVLKDYANNFSISVSDPGSGPAVKTLDSLGTRHSGLGTRIVETLARQIDAALATELSATGYTVTVTVPHRGTSY